MNPVYLYFACLHMSFEVFNTYPGWHEYVGWASHLLVAALKVVPDGQIGVPTHVGGALLKL